MIAFFFLAACGKKGPLVPPEALAPSPVTDLDVRQVGSRFIVCLTPPTRNDAGGPLKNLAGFQVLKREVLPPDVDCEACTGAYRLFRLVDMEYPGNAMRFANMYCLYDDDLVIGKTYQYKVVSLQADGTMSRDSNKVRRKFLLPPAAPVLHATSTETGIILQWTTPPPTTGVLVGYNIYRSESAERMPLNPINPVPVQGNRYEDKTVLFGMKYRYIIRALAKIDGELVESSSSGRVSGELQLDVE